MTRWTTIKGQYHTREDALAARATARATGLEARMVKGTVNRVERWYVQVKAR